MHGYFPNNGVTKILRCDKSQTVRAEHFQLFCKSNNSKIMFATVVDHKTIGVVLRMMPKVKKIKFEVYEDRQN